MFGRFFLLSLVILSIQTVNAQNHTITGTVFDQQAKTPLASASVRLRSTSDSAFRQNMLTDSSGTFTFSNLPSDSFLVTISYVGYNAITRGIRMDTTDISIRIGVVPNTSSDLSTVVITARISPVTQKGDTVEMNASQYKVNPDASGEDLVKKMPGITIENGQVKAHGENVQKVTIDGRELFGDDATAALRNLPAEIIDKIQVYDRMSDQAQFTGFDDGNTTKAINVVTKVNMRNGQYGRVFAGYGTDGRYLAGGNATIFSGDKRISLVALTNNVNQQNFSQQDLLGVTSSSSQRGGGGGRNGGPGGRGGGGQGGNGGQGFGGFGNNSNFLVGQQSGINKTNSAGINYSDIWSKKITISASYFFNNTQNTNEQISSIRYNNPKVPSIFDTTNSSSNNTNHRFNVRFEYKIDSFNQLIILPSLSFQSNTSNRFDNSSSAYETGRNVNNVQSSNNSNTSGNNLNNTILYRHAFHKRGRTISLNLNTSYNQKLGDVYTDINQQLYDSTGTPRTITDNRYTNQSNKGYQLSANLVYTEPIGKSSQLQLNYNPTYSNSNADQEAFRMDSTYSKYSIFDTSLSNKFNSEYIAQNGGIGYRYGNRDNQFSIGASFQHSQLISSRTFPSPFELNKSFEHVLPNAMARFKLSTRSNLRIFYRANVNQPSVTQLQDVYDITNSPYFTTGNPDLKPQYNHLVTTRYTFTNTSKGLLFVGNVLIQAANNYITSATYVPILRDSVINSHVVIPVGGQLTKPVNLNGYFNLRSFLTFATPVKFIKSNLNFNGGIAYSKLPGILNNLSSESKAMTYTFGSVIGSNISQYVDFTISYSGNYNTVRSTSAQKNTALTTTTNTNYFQHTASVSLNLLSKSGWFYQTDAANQLLTGYANSGNQIYTIWNMSAGKKFLKNQKGELKLTVFDLLKQNQAYTRTVNSVYIQDLQSIVLQRYFMLTFTYNLRNFGAAPARNNNFGNRGGDFRRWGGGM